MRRRRRVVPEVPPELHRLAPEVYGTGGDALARWTDDVIAALVASGVDLDTATGWTVEHTGLDAAGWYINTRAPL